MVTTRPQNIPNNRGIGNGIDPTDAIPPAKNAGFLDKAANFFSTATSKLINVIGWSPVFAPMAASLLLGVSKFGKITRIGTIERAGDSAHGYLTGIMNKTVGEVFTGDTSKTIGYVSQKVLKVAGDGADRVVSTTRAHVIGGLSERNAARHLVKLNKYATQIEASIDPNAPQHVRATIKRMVGLASQNGIPPTKFAEHSQAFADFMTQNGNHFDKDGRNLLNKILKTTTKAVNSTNNAAIWRNPSRMLAALPSAIGSSKLLPGIANVTFIVLSLIGIGKTIANHIKTHSETKAASKNAGTTSPELVNEANSKLRSSTGVSLVTDFMSLFMNIASAVKGNVSFAGFVLPQVAGGLANAAIGTSSLEKLAGLEKMHAAGQKIPAQAYAELIGSASNELKARGGDGSAFAQELGKIYADMQSDPAQVFRRAVNGAIMHDINALIKANETAEKAFKDTATGAATTGSHVAALRNRGVDAEQKTTYGRHTEELVRKASQAKASLEPALNGA